jgi:hypothetical protein
MDLAKSQRNIDMAQAVEDAVKGANLLTAVGGGQGHNSQMRAAHCEGKGLHLLCEQLSQIAAVLRTFWVLLRPSRAWRRSRGAILLHPGAQGWAYTHLTVRRYPPRDHRAAAAAARHRAAACHRPSCRCQLGGARLSALPATAGTTPARRHELRNTSEVTPRNGGR